MISSKFSHVEDKINFPEKEEEVLKYWEKIDAFKTQLKKTENCPVYTFYDGPPFATGRPHYGHIAAGTIKDVVTRYWTQTGRYVERRFGWDCHGLPVEVIINKKLNINTKKDLLNFGIENYNNECRKIVMEYAGDWRYYVNRLGRWIDFDNDYKTLDPSFMESVWWVFKEIFDKGLVYRKCKVMPYSPACNTVLSNFEAGMNYQDINDPSIIVTFPSKTDPNVSFLAWTTTPWTLPSNLFLAVNPSFDYVHIQLQGEERQYIFAESLLANVAKKLKIDGKYEIVKKYKGSELHGMEYEPLFTEFYEQFHSKGCFKVYTAEYVSSSDGTGIVHNAPGFGEDDYNVGLKYNLIDPDNPLSPIDDDGFFLESFPLVAGKYFKDADLIIIENLKQRKRLLHTETICHKYPLCYRTDKPLMYRAIPSWFISVEKFKDDLVESNKKAYWVPKYVQEKRFHNWLTDARDWCISRNRSWGNPIPIWVSDDFEEKVCIGSIEDLKKYTGKEDITDIHREFIDKLTIPSQKGKGNLRRIEEVFDCWFESGSMPYAQIHYPFKISEEEFHKRFPADFIGEGLDQTRGWFYTLNVLSTALFKKNPYKNLIVNGLVLDDKGRKLSKKLGNFDDPKLIFDNFGADAMRLYLINSPLVRAQSLKFSKKGLSDVIKDVFLPLYNSYKFLLQNIQRYETSNKKNFVFDFDLVTKNFSNLNITDRWIIAYNQRLIKFVRTEMENYRLYTVVSELLIFLDKLTNWYIRLNRSRIKGDFGEDDSLQSLNVLFSTLLNLVVLLSPFTPFLTEHIYQNLRNGLDAKSEYLEDSIHYLRIPVPKEELIDTKIEQIMNNMIAVIELGRQLREKNKILLKKPVAYLEIINFDKNFCENLKVVEQYIIEELNANEVLYNQEEEKFIKISAKPNFEVLYKTCKDITQMIKDEDRDDDLQLKEEEAAAKKEANGIAALIKKLNDAQLRELITNKSLVFEGVTINYDMVIIEKKFIDSFTKDKQHICMTNQECGLRMNVVTNENLINTYFTREICNRIQKQRKETGVKISDNIFVQYTIPESDSRLHKICVNYLDIITKVIKVPFRVDKPEDGYVLDSSRDFEVGDDKKEDDKDSIGKEKITITIYKK